MKNVDEIFKVLKEKAEWLGAFKGNVIPTSEVVTDRAFRDMCERNSCGMYGRCWTCPPDAGDIDELIARLRSYRYMFLYQTVGQLEDSFDFENMQECKKKHGEITVSLRAEAKELGLDGALFLAAGGCGVCPVCAKRTGEPCRYPDSALSSLEAYGVYVAKTAEKAGMKYINGQNTVTYFGAILFDL